MRVSLISRLASGAAPGLGLVLAGTLLGACAEPVADPVVELSFPSFESIAGDAPSDDELPDDVKSDGPLPAKYVDLVAKQSPVRMQGQRGVCTIFASTALLEHTLLARGLTDVDYSEQFLQWSHKRERAVPVRTEASSLPEVMETLAVRGTVREAMWPYEEKAWGAPAHPECANPATAPIDCVSNGSPSATALAAPREKLPLGRYLRTSAIKAYLHTQKMPVAIGVELVEEAWSYPPHVQKQRPGAWERGEVPFPSAKELAASAARGRPGHAVIVVGWDDDYAVPVLGDNGLPLVDAAGKAVLERGFYIVKNSWGTDYWGKDNPYGPGYGMISQRYVAELGRAYALGLPSGAPPVAGGETHAGKTAVALPASGVFEDQIEVAVGGPLTQARIDLAIDHARASDLTVELRHDDVTWTIWRGGVGAAVRGAWIMNGLSRVDRGGTWTLRIKDEVAGTSGTLTSWTLTFL